MTATPAAPATPLNATGKCLRFGWWSLLCWLTLGLVLETLHGFKIGWYLDVANEARRLQWSLAHAHGTLLALINLVFATTVRPGPERAATAERAGACLRWAGLLMPAGFLLGGLLVVGADPGLGILLVPVGGVLLFAGVLLAARSLAAAPEPARGSEAPPARAEGKGRKRDA